MPPKQAPPVGAEGRAVRLPVDKKVRKLVHFCLCASASPAARVDTRQLTC